MAKMNQTNNSNLPDHSCFRAKAHTYSFPCGSFAFTGGMTMATKKTTKKTKVTYKGQKYTVMEEQDGRLKLTDGIIHFWVRKESVEA